MMRSEIMSRIKGKWTGPEKKAHNFLKGNHVRHKMHPDLPFHPDVLIKDGGGLLIFIDGCFWHKCPKHYREPKSNVKFWRSKIANNAKRDRKAVRELRRMGYVVRRVLTCKLDEWMEEMKR